jgi:hypothetical protein
MAGFKNEKELWEWQSTRLMGSWARYELIIPAGHPDVKGSYMAQIVYIENKVGDYDTAKHRRSKMEPSQIEYLDWLDMCGQPTYVCFGSKKAKRVTFYRWPDLSNPSPPPPGWTGEYQMTYPRKKLVGTTLSTEE